MKPIAAVFLLSVLPCAAQPPFSNKVNQHVNRLAPYVQSPQQIVDKMLDMAAVKPGETVYDLGCGDGRILFTAAQRFHAKAVGVELSDPLAKSTEDMIRRLSLQDQVRVIHGDFMTVNLSPADVVTIYLESASNEMLKPNLEKYLRPGARVVSHDFAVRGWKANYTEKITAFSRPHYIYVYIMPPKVDR
jgi:cyclopropane fatty-acyl-phospholipid synthase-like methyltransferase